MGGHVCFWGESACAPAGYFRNQNYPWHQSSPRKSGPWQPEPRGGLRLRKNALAYELLYEAQSYETQAQSWVVHLRGDRCRSRTAYRLPAALGPLPDRLPPMSAKPCSIEGRRIVAGDWTKPLRLLWILVCLLCLARPGLAAVPYVILKFDDLDSGTGDGGQLQPDAWQNVRWATTVCSNAGVKCSVGMWTKTLETTRNADYTNYLAGLTRPNSNCELWFHGHTGLGDQSLQSLAQQRADFQAGRRLGLTKLNYTFRAWGPHWLDGNPDTATVFNEDSSHVLWLRYTTVDATGFDYSLLIKPEAMILEGGPNGYLGYSPCVELEGSAHDPVSLATFISNFNSYTGRSYLILQGHPFEYSAGSASRANFTTIVNWLGSEQTAGRIRTTTPFGYYKIVHGITDTTRPPAPTNLRFARF